MENKIHQCVYLRIGLDRLSSKYQGVTISDVQTLNDKGDKTIAATWFYQIGDVVVNVMYVRDGFSCEGLLDAWHPKNGSNNFQIANCFYADVDR